MAKLKGPIFSLDARGKAGPLVFEKTGKTNYAKSNKWSKKPPTDEQKKRQLNYGLGVSAWSKLSTAEKDEWTEYAKDKAGSGFNYFMQMILTAFDVGIYGASSFNAVSYGK